MLTIHFIIHSTPPHSLNQLALTLILYRTGTNKTRSSFSSQYGHTSSEVLKASYRTISNKVQCVCVWERESVYVCDCVCLIPGQRSRGLIQIYIKVKLNTESNFISKLLLSLPLLLLLLTPPLSHTLQDGDTAMTLLSKYYREHPYRFNEFVVEATHSHRRMYLFDMVRRNPIEFTHFSSLFAHALFFMPTIAPAPIHLFLTPPLYSSLSPQLPSIMPPLLSLSHTFLFSLYLSPLHFLSPQSI